MSYDDDSLIKPSREHVLVDVSMRTKVGFGVIERNYSEPVRDGFHVHADNKKCVDQVDSLLKLKKMLGLSATTDEEVDSPSKEEENVMELHVPPVFIEEVDLLQKEEVDTPQKDEEFVEELRIPPTATVKSQEPLTVEVEDKKIVEVVGSLSIPDDNGRPQDQVHHPSLRVAPEGVTTVGVVQSSIGSLMESLL